MNTRNQSIAALMLLAAGAQLSGADGLYRSVDAIRVEKDAAKVVHADLGDEDSAARVMELIPQLPKLQTLVVGGPQFADRQLAALAMIPTLRAIVLDSTNVTEQAMMQAREQRPDLIVYRSQRRAIYAIADIALEMVISSEVCRDYPELLELLGDRYFREATLVSTQRLPDEESGPWKKIPRERLEPLRLMTTLKQVGIGWSQLDDTGMSYLKDLASLESLSLPLADISEDGLEHLAGMTNLRSFSGDISNEGLKHLAELKKLEQLNIGSPALTDEGLRHLRGFRHLERLVLVESGVQGRGLCHVTRSLESLNCRKSALCDLSGVAGMTGLRKLDLDETQIVDATMAHLSGAANLQWLSLPDTQIGDEGVAHLSGLANLEVLDLRRTKVGDAGLEQMRRLPSLRSLLLEDTNVSDAGLAHLKNFPNLRYVNLHNTRITNKGLKRLKKCSLWNLRVNLPLDEEGIACLEGMMTLRSLYVRLPGIKRGEPSERAALEERLKRALPPGCKVVVEQPIYIK